MKRHERNVVPVGVQGDWSGAVVQGCLTNSLPSESSGGLKYWSMDCVNPSQQHSVIFCLYLTLRIGQGLRLMQKKEVSELITFNTVKTDSY